MSIRQIILASLTGAAYAFMVYGLMVATFHLWAWLGEPQPTGKVGLDGVSRIEEDL